MSHDAINSWVNKAKNTPHHAAVAAGGIMVIQHVQSHGNLIMEIAEKIRPHLQKMFMGGRDNEGMLIQPAHIRGIALDVAQEIAKRQTETKKY